MARPKTISWQDNSLLLLDQRKLPLQVEYKRCENVEDVAEAIRSLLVRGAPAIGAAAAYGMVLAALNSNEETIREDLSRAGEKLAGTRPTAVNLFWAIEKMMTAAAEVQGYAAIYQRLLEEAHSILEQDVISNRAMGKLGAQLLPPKARVLTICNAGALATADWGTALGVIRSAGRDVKVYACETRPVLQGARLTAWELLEDGFDVTLICDSMAGTVMAQGMVDAVIAGADRIAANGDTANKIGTYSLAVLAKAHKIPFYIAAPTSTIDEKIASGEEIIIEERAADEVTHIGGQRIAPSGVKVYNPAFDVTPANLISAIITEQGVFRFPYQGKLSK